VDTDLTAEQAAILDLARDFGAARIAPQARAWESAGTIPRDVLSDAAALGFGALCVPDALGGTGLCRHDATLVFEGLGMACPAVAAFISIHNMVTQMVASHATPGARDRWLPGLIAMRTIGAYCLTEPGSGSDAAALGTRAERMTDGWRLTGTKSFISGAGFSDLYVVMARSGGPGPKGISAILVPDGSPGLGFGRPEDKMGWRAQPTAQVMLDGCTVPDDCLLGAEGSGFRLAMQGLDGGRLNIAACALGAAQTALTAALAHVRERHAFGAPLADLQTVQFRLADMQTGLQAARVMLRRAARSLDRGDSDATAWCAMAKRFVTDTAFTVANEALQLHGGYGYLADYGIEKIVRDLRVHQILEGSNEIMRLIVARHLLEQA
jgi:alkylation response protein AidB-like acyl-CoA dehydrogenase